MIQEFVDRRMIAAITFVDAVTGFPVREPLQITADNARFVRNTSGMHVVLSAPGYDDYTREFLNPVAPAAGNIDLTVSDPSMTWLSRRARIAIPRDLDPANAANADSIFRPAQVRLFPSSRAASAQSWAVIRATVVDQPTGDPLSNALVRVLRTSDGAVIGRGMSDTRGEAMVAVAGIPTVVMGAGAGPVLGTGIDVSIEAIFDPAGPAIPDPDDIETRAATLRSVSSPDHIASGSILARRVEVP